MALALTAIVAALSVTVGGDPRYSSGGLRQHLGGEYYNIGRALVDGRGFSDPFGERTGPTAWMAPAYPLLLAGILAMTDSRHAAATIIVVITNLTWIAIGTAIYAIARRRRQRLDPLLSVAFYVVWIWAFDYWTLLLTHDVWLTALAVTLLVLATHRLLATGKHSRWTWGALGGLLALINPALALAWLCFVALFLARSAGTRRQWALAVGIAVALALPWTIRNALVLHQFAPTKSNFFYDAYLTNYVDDDGILDARSIASHPYVSPTARFEYALDGESAYMTKYRKMFAEALAKDPAAFVRRIAHRAVAASVRYVPWSAYDEDPLGTKIRQALYPVPLLTFLVSFWIRGPNRPMLLTLGLLATAYLTPYVLISLYARYWVALTPALVLIVFLGLDQIAYRLFPKGWPDASRGA